MLKAPHITLIFLWIIFGVVHSGLTSGFITRAASKLMGKTAKYYRAIASLLIFITLLILIHYHFAAIDTILFRPHWVEKIIAAILLLSGFAVMIVYTWNYLMSFSGLGIVFGMEDNSELQQSGLYGYVRHPMFAGAIIFIWGVFFGYPYMNNLVSAVCLTIYAFVRINLLEKKLLKIYGDQYRQYRLRVSRLLPFGRK